MKQQVVEILQNVSPESIDEHMIEVPTHSHLGDYALPCFSFAKKMRNTWLMLFLSLVTEPNVWQS